METQAQDTTNVGTMVSNSLDTKLRDRRKSATYYARHRAEVLAKRKERYEANKERLQTIQREYARKKRAALKAARPQGDQLN